MDVRTVLVVLVVIGVVALVVGVVAIRAGSGRRRRERAAVPATGVVRSVLWTDNGSSVRLGLAWRAPDGSGEREGVWHGGGGLGVDYGIGQQVPLRVGRDDDWVQLASAPRQSVVDGCVGAGFLVVGVVVLLVAAATAVLTG
ncbi:hypothetical protein [Jannaschia sp. R86511]|uniref:hypothetical protein n=1 Tax=Jannaschia sp. R86511 TaxID=3093853 RepID=UPI0036D3E98C